MKKVGVLFLVMLLTLALIPGAGAEETYVFPWTGEEKTIDYYYVDFRYAGRTYDALIDEEFQKAIGNVKINDMSLGWADYGTKLNLYFSSGELPDILFGNSTLAAQYANSNILLDFAPYLGLMPNYVALSEKFPNTFVEVDGQILSVAQCRDVVINSKVWYVNNHFLNSGDYGIPETTSELLDILRAVKVDYPDMYPMLGGWDGVNEQLMMQFDTRQGMFYNFDAKAWEYGPINDGFREYVEFMATLVAEGLIAPDYANRPDDQFQLQFNDPLGWYIYSGYNEMYPATVATMQEVVSDYFPIDLLPPMAEGHTRRVWTEAFLGQPLDGIYSSINTKDPEFLAAFLDHLISDEIGTLVNWGVEGVTFEYDGDGDKRYMDTLKLDSNPSVGTVLPLQDLGLTAHFMIKQMGLATKNDFVAMDTYLISEDQMARQHRIADYIAEHPESEVYAMPRPPFTPDESEELAFMSTDLDTYVSENMALFIAGAKPMSEWDAFVDGIHTIADIELMVNLYNSYETPVWVNK